MADGIDKRVNYFDRQFLKAEDFTDEQSYHIERQRLHNRVLHTAGIAEGLTVEIDGDALLVRPGVAIDGQGREIILTGPRAARNLQQYANQSILLVIAYDEQPDEDYRVEVNKQTRYTRIQERPDLAILTAGSAPDDDQITLARVRIDADGNPTDIDDSVRLRAGIRSTGDATIADTIEGDFFVQGNLQVGGNIDYGGQLKLPEFGASSAMWFADDVTSDVAVDQNDAWYVVDGMLVEFEITQDARILCNYGINIQPGDRAAPPDELYTIRAGDTLGDIALKYYGKASESATIQAYNNLSYQDTRSLQVGNQIKIPLAGAATAAPASITDDFVATRIAINDTAYPASGAFFQPSDDTLPSNIALNGTLALSLGEGVYRVSLQWYKFGDGLTAWGCASQSLGAAAAKGFLAGRSLIVTAFYG